MADQPHKQFAEIRMAMQDIATKRGDKPFADALEECVIYATGGNDRCPMGRLILDDYLKTGKMLQPEISHQHRDAPPQKILPREAILNHVQKLLKDSASATKDDAYLSALTECEHSMQGDDQCPLHRLLQKGKSDH